MKVEKQTVSVSTKAVSNLATRYIAVPCLLWLGGAVHFYNLPGYGFWDALIWLYYIGRYIALHFTAL